MLSGSLAQSCSLARLTVHALLAHFRLLMSDLENLRHACARAQIFQVRQQDSKGIEHSMYRKTVLTHFEEKRQHPATYGWTYSPIRYRVFLSLPFLACLNLSLIPGRQARRTGVTAAV